MQTADKRFGPLLALVLTALLGVAFSSAALAELKTTKPPLKQVHINTANTAAMRTGAMYFMHQCAACHSLQGMRYSELAGPTKLTVKQVQAFLKVSHRRVLNTIVSPMPPMLAKKYFGTVPPDLTNEVRRRGVNWLYTYLTSFYVDPSRPTGANNVVFHNVAMPDVFAGLQGLQAPIMKPGLRLGKHTPVAIGVKPLTQGRMTASQFDQTARDLVTFLTYTSYPHRLQSHAIGFWVLIGIAVWIILTYIMYRLFWRDVIRPHGRWFSYWRKNR